MGRNSRRRRAEVRRDAARSQGRRRQAYRPAAGDPTNRRSEDLVPPQREAAEEDRVAEQARLAGLVADLVRLTDGTRRDDARLDTYADMLLARAAPHDPDAVVEAMGRHLATTLRRVRRAGWPDGDLARLVERTLGPAHLPTLDAQLRGRPLRDLASGLGLAALLARTPRTETAALADPARTRTTAEHPKLAQVRALLAKAESTEHPEEAELLSAKAQELVSRHALDGLLAAGDGVDRAPRPELRRVWLDAPYVDAKVTLVAEVAHANRCRTAAAVPLGFSIVVGDARDLDLVELLTTSLLVQAGVAMRHHERRVGTDGRTRSFRRAFLLAYATRVGERLREATRAAYAEAGGDVLPVLAGQEERVRTAFEAAVPHTVARSGASVSNHRGWLAGRAAADLARLDPHERLEEG